MPYLLHDRTLVHRIYGTNFKWFLNKYEPQRCMKLNSEPNIPTHPAHLPQKYQPP